MIKKQKANGKGSTRSEFVLLALVLSLLFVFVGSNLLLTFNGLELTLDGIYVINDRSWKDSLDYYLDNNQNNDDNHRIDSPVGASNLITGAAVGDNSNGEEGLAVSSENTGGGMIGIFNEANSTSCGNITSNLTLTANVNSTATCFAFNASGVTLDCAGYTVTYNNGGGGTDGITNNDGFDNITIKNCNILPKVDITGNQRAVLFNYSNNVIFINNTISTTGGTHNDCFRSQYGDNPIVANNTCLVNGTGHNNAGLRVFGGLGGTISNNNITVYGNDTSSGISLDIRTSYSSFQNHTVVRGNLIYLRDNWTSADGILGGYNSTISFNNITIYAINSSYGIDLPSTSSVVEDNIITINGTSSIYGVYYQLSFNDTTARNTIRVNSTTLGYGIRSGGDMISNNTVTVTGSGNNHTGIIFNGGFVDINPVVENNIVNVYGASNNYALDSETACCEANVTFQNNTLTSNGTGSNNYGLYIGNAGGDHYYNNSIRSLSGAYSIFDSNGSSGADYFRYSNTFGKISWDEKVDNPKTIDNLTTNATLIIGNGIFLQDNLIGVADVPEIGFLNQTPNITFYGLTASGGKQLLRNGVVCGSPACNFTYVAQSTTLSAAVNSFSNYTTYYESVLPNVTNLLPTLNYKANTTLAVEIGANITDANKISLATVNVTLPNGTINVLTLSNGTTFVDKWNTSFSLTWLTGDYNVTFIGTDIFGNVNSTQWTNFSVKVGCGTISTEGQTVTLDQNIVTTDNTCFTVQASGVIINGNSYLMTGDLDGGGDVAAVLLDNINHTYISNLNVTNFASGIMLNNQNTSNHTINNSVFFNQTYYGFRIQYARNVTIKNIHIPFINGTALSVSDTDNLYVDNFSVRDTRADTVLTLSQSNKYTNNVYFNRVNITNGNNAVYAVDNTSLLTINNSAFYNQSGAVISSLADDLTIINSQFRNVSGISVTGAVNITIFNNTFYNVTPNAHFITAINVNISQNSFNQSNLLSFGNVEGATIYNNMFYCTSCTGIGVSESYSMNHTTIKGNNFTGGMSNGGISFNGVKTNNITISDNYFNNVSGEASIFLNNTLDIYINSNNYTNPSSSFVALRNSNNTYVQHNMINVGSASYRFISLDSMLKMYTLLFNNNTIFGAQSITSTENHGNITISNNRFVSKTGATIIVLSNNTGVTITGNIFENLSTGGIISLSFNNITNLTLKNNLFQQVRNSEGSLSSDAVGINQSTNVLFTDNNIIESGEGYTIGEDYYISLSPMTFSGVAYANTTLILYDADNSDPITSNNFLLDNAFFNATKNYDVFTTATCTEIGAPNNYCTIYAETSLFANCANVLAFMPLTSCFSFNNNILTSNGAGNNYTAATSQFNSTFNVTTSYTYPPSISYNPSTGETYGILVDRSCNADLSNNTLINATLRFSGNSSCLAQLRYTNTNGTIAWTEQNFLSNLSLNGNLNVSAGLGISMGNNTISVNTSAFNSTTSRISSSANITLTGIKLSNVNRIMKLGAFTTNTSLIQTTGSDCIAAGTCWNLSYSGGNLLFNTTSFSSFSANESVAADTTRPLVNTTLPTVNSVYNITNIFEIAVNSTDETAISRVFVNVTYPNGTIYNFELYNKTNFPNKYNGSITLDLLRGLYNITYIANDTSNNINSSTTSNFTVNVECASIFMGAYITLHKNINSASDCFILNTNGITIDCVGYNILYATGGSGGEGVTSTGYNNITVKNCFIKGGDVGGFGDAGIRFQDGTIANFTNNTILSNGSSSANAVFIYNGTQVVINNNTLITAGSGNDNSGIELGLNSTGVNVTNNIISTNGTFNNHGIEIEEDSHHNRFTNNQITTNGTGTGGFNNGIYMYTNASSNYFENIHILTSGQKNSSALHITGISKKNTFVNVNFTVSNIDTEELVDGTGSNAVNYLVYNNSFGEIKWTDETTAFGFLQGMSTNISNSDGLGLGRNIFIGNNTIAFNISAVVINDQGTIQINSSANITLYGIGLSTVKRIMKVNNYTTSAEDIQVHGSDCIAAGTCFNLSYSGGTLVFNTTGFSSFSANESVFSDTTKPLVNTSLPAINSVYNITNIFEIAVNSTDETAISRVFVNVTYPNGTIIQLPLNNASAHNDKFNASFNIPELVGVYNITYIANDSSNNINSSQTSNFTVKVGCAVINSNLIMDQNVSSSSTCFTFNASNIILDCSNYMINATGVAINLTNDNTTLINCLIQPSEIMTIDDTSSGMNTLIYNNSEGQINWSLTNLTTNISLKVGSTIFIENDNVGLTDDAQALNLDGPARIELRNLSYKLITPLLIKDGVTCSDSPACNITFNSSTEILSADISSFSNYTSAIGCGTFNTSITLTHDITAYGTCYFVDNPNTILDCQGHSITYADGISGIGINSSSNHDNITIKNCVFISAGIGSNNYGIYMKDGIPTFGSVVGSTIVNNTIYTEGNNSNHGIFIHTNYNYTSIINNRIYTNGSGGNNYGIFISDHAYFTNVTNNLIYTNGTGFDYGIYVHNSSSNTFIMNNTIHTYGSSSNYGIFLSLETNSSRIINNSIYTNGTGGNNYGIVINDSVFFTNITGNTISTNGTSFNYGISISSASENILESNLITPDGSASGNDGVRIEGTSSSNVLLNNTILGDSATQSIIDANSSTTNTLLYKNSFGQINWTLANLTANISLAIGNTIFIESNKVGLTDDAQALNLDGPARIELRNLAFTTPQLLKDGDVCSTPSCNISYDSVTDIIYANVSSFSNYSARETPGTASDSEGSSSSGSGSGGGSCASGYHVVDGECVKATVEEEIQEDQKVDEKESGKEDGYIDQDEDGSRDLLIEEDSATSEEFVKPEDRGKAFAGMAFFDGLFTSTGDLSTPLIALLVLLFLAVVISLIVGMMKRGKKKYYPLVPLNQTGRDIYLQNRLAILKSKLQMAKDQKVVELESKQTLEEKAGLLRETIRKKQMILEQEKADKFKQAELGARQRIVDRQARILELHPRQEENLLLERERLELKRSEQEKLEQERLGLRRSEHERLEPERLNLKRLEQERLERRMNELKRLIEAKKKNSRM